VTFNRSSRIVHAIAALLGPAAAAAGQTMPDPTKVELTAKAWKMVRERVMSARQTLWKGMKHAAMNTAASDLGREQIAAAIAKRERRALDVHGMRYGSMK
jgi:hypothetical protein